MRALRLSLGLALSAGLSLVASCGQVGGSPNLDVHVDWGLTDPTVDIPMGVDRLRLLVWVGDDTMPAESFHTVAGLDDRDMDGNRELCPSSPENDCTSGGLPPGVPIRMTIEGLDTMGRTTHVGHAGPFVLEHGERRYVDLRMYAANAITMLPEAPATARFLHTTTALDDGRILVVGGFDRVTTMTCDAALPAGAHCFSLSASDDAFLFDPPSGRVRAVRGGMLAARGGHTATVLPDGSVLVAGGSATATLSLVPVSGGMSVNLAPGGGAATYEIFAPGANPEAEDVDGDGDPGRGGFLGAADNPMVPGRLGEERALHAATLLPGGTGRVILAGGGRAPGTFTVFDLERAGGYGVVGSSSLLAPRALPAAITFGTGTNERAWIFGGGTPTDNSELAEAWRAGMGSDRIGSTATPMGFPDASSTDRSGFSLARPNVEILADGTHALVVGWLGPLCEDGATTPVYSPVTPVLCPYVSTESRSFTVAASTGLATPTTTRNGHSLGATARLDDGRVVLTGGFDSLGLVARNTTELFSGTVTGGAAVLSDVRPPMGAARALHSTTALIDRGYVTFGGISPSADGSTLTLVGGLEVVYLR